MDTTIDDRQNIYQQRRLKNARNAQNNANVIRNAANVAIKSKNPYAVAIGTAVKAADKFSGGRASEKLGKQLNFANKITPGGRITQGVLNKMSESGAADAIGGMANKNNNDKKNNNKLITNDAKSSEAETPNEDESIDKSFNNGVKIAISMVMVQLMMGLLGIVLAALPFILLLIAPQVIIKTVGLGSADEVSDEDLNDSIENAKEDELNEEVTDDDLSFNIFIDDYSFSFSNNKFAESNLIMTESISNRDVDEKYEESLLDNLNDFYPSAETYSEIYDDRLVYDFFFKMYKLYYYYKDNYKVELNLPLLMSTLQVQSSDMNEVFSSNLSEEDRKATVRESFDEFDYYYDWSNYVTTPTNSVNDMAILAQNMVSVSSQTGCASDGKCYVIDEKKYKTFLEEFLEKKYYSGDNNNESSKNSCISKEFAKYDLTDDQLAQIASVAYHEQGNPKGAAAEASLMANRFELYGSKYGTGADGLYNYVRTSRWFSNAASHMDSYDASEEIISAVKSVLVDGKRTLPGYVDEHDCIVCYNDGRGDIVSATNDGSSINVKDKNAYIQHKTKIVNAYMNSWEYYVFYSFPTETSDPFGYTQESLRKKIGDFHYDFDTGQPSNCQSSTTGEWRNWTQCGQSWSNIKLGNGSQTDTMCQIGCLVTSLSIQIARSGTFLTTQNFDPGVAVKYYNFSNNGSLTSYYNELAPNFKFFTNINTVGLSKSAVKDKILSYDTDKYYMILGVGRKEKSGLHHFVALDYADPETGEIYILDPYPQETNKLYDTYKLYRIIIMVKED